MSQPSPALVSALSDRYAIEREIGEGGMSTVYLARDLKHDRDVALKVLRPELTAAVGAERFLREIRITASLDHPRILTLIDSGEAGGFLYCVLPFVQGESVRQRLERDGPLPVREGIAVARQVAGALDFAHRRGIVHRDIKPENVLLQEGEALLVDFGIALAVRDAGVGRLTGEGIWLGSPSYMAPEQLTGDHQGDARSDVYALAAVLFEMLAGEPPYTARSVPALVAKRLVDPVPSVRRLRPSVPAAVDRALRRALAAAPGDRFPTARDFADALDAREPPDEARSSVAVLPFLSLSAEPDNEYFADGVTEDLIAHLAKIRDLRVLARASVMPFKDRKHSLREIAAQLQTHRLVDGSVRRAGDRVRIVAQLIDADNDLQLWSETYDRRLTDIFAIQTDVALSIAAALEARLSPDERTRIRKEPTSDLQAYGLYQQGRHWLLRYTVEGVRRAIGYFEQAIERDPMYALAHVGVCLAYIELTEMGAERPDVGHPSAKAAVARALEIDECLGEAHCMSAYLSALADYDWTRAEEGFKRALELSPSSSDAWDLYGRMCSALRRFDESLEMVRRAEALDPLAHRSDVANMLLRAGRFDEALAAARTMVALDPGYDRGRATLGWALIRTGKPSQGIDELELAVELAAGNHQWLAQLGQAYGSLGQPDRARAILTELHEIAKRSYVSPYHFVFVHVGLGEHDQAIDILERVIDDRAAASYGIDGSFLLAPLRDHPRYRVLQEKLRLPSVARTG